MAGYMLNIKAGQIIAFHIFMSMYDETIDESLFHSVVLNLQFIKSFMLAHLNVMSMRYFRTLQAFLNILAIIRLDFQMSLILTNELIGCFLC